MQTPPPPPMHVLSHGARFWGLWAGRQWQAHLPKQAHELLSAQEPARNRAGGQDEAEEGGALQAGARGRAWARMHHPCVGR